LGLIGGVASLLLFAGSGIASARGGGVHGGGGGFHGGGGGFHGGNLHAGSAFHGAPVSRGGWQGGQAIGRGWRGGPTYSGGWRGHGGGYAVSPYGGWA